MKVNQIRNPTKKLRKKLGNGHITTVLVHSPEFDLYLTFASDISDIRVLR
jgi:hypothetical protein